MKIDRLLLSKYLFQNGQDFLRRDDPYSHGLAVSLFQDAVECLLYSIAVQVKASFPKKYGFMDYWSIIEAAPDNIKKIDPPSRPQMEQLNRDRVDFKHYGSLPAPLTARNHAFNAESFLRESMEVFFGVKFDELSRADFVSDNTIRMFIKEAEKYFNQGKYGECIVECAKAVRITEASLKPISPGRTFIRSLNIDRTGDRQLDRNLNRIVEYFDEADSRNVEFLLIVALQIKIADYKKFYSIVPGVVETYKAGWDVLHKKSEYSLDEADFCLKYVIDFAMAVQNRV